MILKQFENGLIISKSRTPGIFGAEMIIDGRELYVCDTSVEGAINSLLESINWTFNSDSDFGSTEQKDNDMDDASDLVAMDNSNFPQGYSELNA